MHVYIRMLDVCGLAVGSMSAYCGADVGYVCASSEFVLDCCACYVGLCWLAVRVLFIVCGFDAGCMCAICEIPV